jgi:hypothetical protein
MATSTKVAIGVVTGIILLGAILGVSLYFGLAGRNSVLHTKMFSFRCYLRQLEIQIWLLPIRSLPSFNGVRSNRGFVEEFFK